MAVNRSGWRTGRRWVQAISLIGWIVGFILLVHPQIPFQLAHGIILVDPLLSWNQSIASQQFSRWVVPGLILFISGFIFGRAWCGWICPVGTTLDIFGYFMPKKTTKKVPDYWRKGKYLLAGMIVLAAIAGNLTLLMFDPITIWMRVMSGGIWPAVNQAFTRMEEVLVQIDWLTPAVIWLDQLLRPIVFPTLVPGATTVSIQLLIGLMIVTLSLIAARFWCRYLCPLGGMLGWLARFSFMQRRVSQSCTACGACARVCPTDTIDPQRDFQSDPAECTLCMNCMGACPTSQIKFQSKLSKPVSQPYDPNRREFLAASLLTLSGLAVAGVEEKHNHRSKPVLRPPGVDNDNFSSQCLRCGICVRVCPTGAIQPGITSVTWSDLLTPVLDLRTGYCLYSCNECGVSCPVEAIPPLALVEKQTFVIGHAFIDHNRCIPWAEGGSCIICEEMCPLPEKAITLEERVETLADGSSLTLRLPVVNQDLCIGCGTCENKCPRSGDAAIRVYPLDPA